MSHSKRNTSLAFFTSYERGLLKNNWGSQRSRLTRESFLQFGACQLCLLQAQDPVACGGCPPSNGQSGISHNSTDVVNNLKRPKKQDRQCHVFCRECILANLLAQREAIKQMSASQAAGRADAEAADVAEELAAAQRSVRDFERTQMGFDDQNATKSRSVSASASLEVERPRGAKRKFELDEDELIMIARKERDRAKSAIREEQVCPIPTRNNVHDAQRMLIIDRRPPHKNLLYRHSGYHPRYH